MKTKIHYWTYLISVLIAPCMGDTHTERPEFISANLNKLVPITTPQDYFESPRDLDEAQLFFAPCKNGFFSDLRNAEISIVAPYHTVYHEELRSKQLQVAWGTLDIYSYRRKKQDYQFWCRPSNVFYSITHVANINHKLPSPCFSHWFKTHDIPAQFPSEQLKALKKGTNFSNCPWENMINKRTKSKNLLVSLQTDWNKSNSDTSWSNRWNMSNYIKNTSPIVDTQWSNNYSQILNKSNTSYDGLLTLKDRYMMEDILSPNTENSETLYRLLPFCAKTRHFSAPPMGDPSANHIQFDSHLLKAVIISSNKSYIPMKVLAICCDWINTIPNQDSDALPINKQFKKEGGINDTDLVNKPEFSRIPKDYFRVDTLKGSICWNSDSLNTNLDLNEEIPLSEIAILAKNNNFTIKAIIAIPANHKIKKRRVLPPLERRHLPSIKTFLNNLYPSITILNLLDRLHHYPT